MVKKDVVVSTGEVLLSGVVKTKVRNRRKTDAEARKNGIVDSNLKSVLKDASLVAEFSSSNEIEKTTRAEKYSRGEGIDVKNPGIKNKTLKHKILDREDEIKYSETLAARTEVLLGEAHGFIESDENEVTRTLTQSQIRKAVDITSACKQFELSLNFGPYRLDYTRNGRHLLLGGRQGHVSAFDWITKQLKFEINVMESVHDVQWLHVETMLAVAQKTWLYVYNNQGVELHCVQDIHKPLRLEFLPYHFLLAAATEIGWIKWLDVSMGKVIGGYNTNKGRLGVLTQNPYNAVLCSGHSNGTVCMWSPNTKKPVASMLCHNSNVQAIAVDPAGYYMATSGCQKDMKVWDVRQLNGPLQHYKLLGGSASDLSFSQTGLLSASCGNTVQIYKDCVRETAREPYLIHRTGRSVQNIQFSAFEDVLGVATDSGFTSLLVPGAGEANFDALEVNPLRSKKQRQETEVRSLLDKIPPEMISLDPTVLSEVDLPSLKEKWDAKRKILYARATDISFVPRNKKRQGKSLRRDQVKRIVKEDTKKTFYKKIGAVKEKLLEEGKEETGIQRRKSVLDRFRPKKRTKPNASSPDS